jgi:hypothetical protein
MRHASDPPTGKQAFMIHKPIDRFPLKLDIEECGHLDEEQIRLELIPLIRSNHFSIDMPNNNVLIEGPDTSYHKIDPFLQDGLCALDVPTNYKEIGQFYRIGNHLDLCFEDSWCGLFIANHIRTLETDIPLTIIHLDDHTDMMSTLLLYDEGLFDPISQQAFAPDNPRHWPMAIESGAVGIGSFLTPFFSLRRSVHIRHLKADTGSLKTFKVGNTVCHQHLLKELPFFDISLQEVPEASDAMNTYQITGNAERLFDNIAEGSVIVHIDLDYFINDFNGNAFQGSYLPSKNSLETAERRMKTFFTTLRKSGVKVDRWMIATSPGFCSGIHWHVLLEKLEMYIAKYS